MSLQTGTELVSLALLFNKATGFYGFLTLLTGFAPSALQVTWYALSLVIIGALAYLIPHVRKQSPFENLALAWLYVLDTFWNIGYTAAFGTIWYLTLGSQPNDGDPEHAANPDTAASMVLVTVFTLTRLYFSLVVISHARNVLRRYLNEERGADELVANGSSPNPFDKGSALGDGWRGKLGRVMIVVGRGYWLGRREEDEEWVRDVGSKFRGRRGT